MGEERREMSYFVKDYMTKAITTINYEATVSEAAKAMAADESLEGYTVVLKEGKPVGMVTERDIVNKVLAVDRSPGRTKVAEIMTSPLITVDPDEDLLQASQLMRERHVRKLVVIRGDIIYGILTAKDIAQQCGDYVNQSIKDITRWTLLI